MKIIFEDKIYDIFEIINNTFFIKNDNGDIMKCRDIEFFDIECKKCSSIIHLKHIGKCHLIKDFFCRSCRTSGEKNPMYGKIMSDEKRSILSEKYSGEKNPFFGKKHTNETKNKIGNKNKEHMIGENNPMYKKSFFDVWIKKYGMEKAKKMLEKKSSEHSNKMKGDKNPFFGKSHTNISKLKIIETLKTGKHSEIIKSKKYRQNMSNKTKNRVLSDEHIRKLRLARIKNIKYLNNGKILPNFNSIGCKILDKISKEKNVHIRHAMNGGEFHINELGYWVDGYDKINNVVYEIDEKRHFDFDGNLKEKDIKRQTQIQEHLGCQFIRIKI